MESAPDGSTLLLEQKGAHTDLVEVHFIIHERGAV